jgi:hypothetical protein
MYNLILSDPNKKNITSVGSVKIIERNATNYGTAFWENILHLVENYSSISPPNFPIEGQLWFNPASSVLSISTIDEAGNNSWMFISDVYDEVTPVYVDVHTSNTIRDLTIPRIVNETVYTGPGQNSNDAATKKFVDDWHSGIKTGSDVGFNWITYPNNFCIIHGSGSGDITLPFEMLNTEYAVIVTNQGTASIAQYAIHKTTKSFTVSNNMWMVTGFKK